MSGHRSEGESALGARQVGRIGVNMKNGQCPSADVGLGGMEGNPHPLQGHRHLAESNHGTPAPGSTGSAQHQCIAPLQFSGTRIIGWSTYFGVPGASL